MGTAACMAWLADGVAWHASGMMSLMHARARVLMRLTGLRIMTALTLAGGRAGAGTRPVVLVTTQKR